jgi:hypothetical protein
MCEQSVSQKVRHLVTWTTQIATSQNKLLELAQARLAGWFWRRLLHHRLANLRQDNE